MAYIDFDVSAHLLDRVTDFRSQRCHFWEAMRPWFSQRGYTLYETIQGQSDDIHPFTTRPTKEVATYQPEPGVLYPHYIPLRRQDVLGYYYGPNWRPLETPTPDNVQLSFFSCWTTSLIFDSGCSCFCSGYIWATCRHKNP
jgi:hypothetical protein